MRFLFILTLFVLISCISEVRAAYICSRDLHPYETVEDCNYACPGGICIASGTYACAKDVNNDGLIEGDEFAQCVEGWRCPLSDDSECDEYRKCTAYFTPECPEGSVLNPSRDLCEAPADIICPSGYTFDRTSGLCTASPQCPQGGGYVPERTRCEASYPCPAGYAYDPDNDVCYASPICPTGGSFQASSGTCVADATINCPEGTTYSSDTALCEAAPTCSQGNYMPDIDQCKAVADCVREWVCPLPGAGRTACVDMGDPTNYQDDFTDFSYFQNNGEYDDSGGTCIGQIYIFSGRPMRCRPPGLQTGFHDCCKADGKVVEQMGRQIDLLSGTLALAKNARKLYEATKVAAKAIQSYKYFHAGVDKWKFIDPQYWSVAVKATSATDAAQRALSAFMGISPSSALGSLAVSFAMDFTARIIFGGCSEDDVVTAAYRENGLCHYIGKKCIKKVPLVGCVQKAKIYCCFNSVLARIIHEQGRPQLESFGFGGGWGSKKHPNCRGFTPEELQMLDFSKMDLSEYVEHYSESIAERMPENAQLEDTMKEKVREFFDSGGSDDTPPPPPPSGAIYLENGERKVLTFNAHAVKLFYFHAAPSSLIPLSVFVGVPSSYSFGYTQMLLVNAGPGCSSPPPTVEQLQTLIDRFHNGEIPNRGQEGNTYWYLGGGLAKNLLVREDMDETCWYLLVYNDSDVVYNDVSVAFTAPE